MKKSTLVIAVLLATFIITGAIFWNPINNIVANINSPDFDGDPDIPRLLKDARNKIGREDFLTKRAEGAALRRGIVKGQEYDPNLRPLAIQQMKNQEEVFAKNASSEQNLVAPAWTAIGPAPIPGGQTSPTRVNVSGRTTAIAIHPTTPDIVYVGTAMGGLYRTTDGGTNWTPMMDDAESLAIGAIAISPSQPDTIYVGTGEGGGSLGFTGVGIYRIDNASTATPMRTGPFGTFTGLAISEIVVHPTNPAIIFTSTAFGIGGLQATSPASVNSSVFRSINATAAVPTFVNLITGSFEFRDIAIDPTDPEILLMNIVAGGGGIFRLTGAVSGGGTFGQVLPLTCTTNSNCRAEIASQRSAGAANATFYVASGDGISGNNRGRLHRSTDGGVTWNTQSTTGFCGGQCFYNLAVAVDPMNASNVYVGGQAIGAGVITARSTNAGVNFTAVNNNIHADTHVIAVSPSNSSIVWTGNDGGIFKSTNSGVSYTSMNNSQFSATQFISIDVHPTDPNFSIGGTQDNGTNFYQPGTNWEHIDDGDGGWAVIDQNAPDTSTVRMYHTYFNSTASNVVGYGTVANTTQASALNWTFRGCLGVANDGINCNDTAVNFYAPLERGPGDPNSIYYGTDRLYRSADTGDNHTVVSQAPIENGVPISSIGISPQNDDVRIVGLNSGGIYGTSTGSATLTNLDSSNTIPNVAINRTIVDPNSATTAWVTLSVFGQSNVWKTTSLSSMTPAWTNATGTGANVIPQVPVSAIVVDPNESDIVYVGTDIGVYYTNDGGTNWYPYGTGLPRVAIFDIAIAPAPTPLLGSGRMVRVATHGKGMYQVPAALGPTAANASIGGRVLSSRGRSINRVTVSLTDSNGQRRITTSNSFGYYKFDDVQVGETYTISANHKRYEFSPRVLTLEDELTGFNITSK